MRVDCHVHSEFSHDSDTKIEDILDYGKLRKLDAIAITDHNTLKGSERARVIRKQDDVEIIPGVEISVPVSPYGLHLIGLFVEEFQAPLDIKEAIENVKKENGVVVLPHPFRNGTGLFYHLRHGFISENDVNLVLGHIDYIEGLTHKSTNNDIKETLDFVKTTEHRMVAGTDCHMPEKLGLVWTEVDDIGKFRVGTALTTISALVKPGWDMMFESLEYYLIDHKFPSEGSEENQSTFNRVVNFVRNMLPDSKVRDILKNKYRKMLTMKRRRFIEREVGSATRILISRKGNSLVLGKD
jgi:hypothetical protein